MLYLLVYTLYEYVHTIRAFCVGSIKSQKMHKTHTYTKMNYNPNVIRVHFS